MFVLRSPASLAVEISWERDNRLWISFYGESRQKFELGQVLTKKGGGVERIFTHDS